MIPVYIAENELDAQLVQELLVTSGIAAHIFGPNVIDAAAPAATTPQIRVVVEHEEADEARRLVHEWQTVPALDADDDGDLLLDSAPLDAEAAADTGAPVFDLDLDFDLGERRH